MKITSVQLKNVRRFVDPVAITGIGPGLNVLSAPNEHGKSTFFDALHAVFFVSHRSFDKTVKPLVPRVGGDPEVTVGFDIDGAHWRLSKCWSSSASRKDAKLWRDGVLTAQKAEAEALLSTLLKAPADGGPAGLLWVRQGVTELQSGGEEQQARRDIMTSVAGEVEAMTGGRRMETARQACRAFLDLHLTGTGRTRVGGGLGKIETEVAHLQQERDRLADEARRLQDDLDRRRQVRRELGELESPAAHQDRADLRRNAEAGLALARAHDQKVQLANGLVARLVAQAERCAAQMDALQDAVAEQGQAQSSMAAAQADVETGRALCEEARQAFDAASQSHKSAAATADLSAQTTRLALRAEQAQAAKIRRKELQSRLASAETLRHRIEGLTAEIAIEVSSADMKALDRLVADLVLAQRSRDNAAASFSVTYAAGGAGKVLRDGTPISGDERHAVPDGVHLDIAGVGQLSIYPAEAENDTGVEQAKTAVAAALNQLGQETVDGARCSDAARALAEAGLREAQADLKALAPKGLAELRAEIAGLPAPVDPDQEIPDAATAEAEEQAARRARDTAAEALEAARSLDQTRRETLNRSEGVLQTAQERLLRAETALAGIDAPEAQLAHLRQAATKAVQETAAARAALAELQKDAPDLAGAEATMKRAQSVADAAATTIARLREERAALDTRISVLSSAAVEEELALTHEQLTQAQSRLDQVQFEIAVNQRLDQALKTAQDRSRENYVAAVHRELLPLLRMIWPDADPVIDAETGLITHLTRREIAEDFDVLSGGTQEQISLLVRLAFAKILAADGRPAPVVLDDAIVYTDDDRIEQMFNALTRQAQDLQIIVFSCRQRAFRALGGEVLSIGRVTEPA
ncbi:AAA family ATPase [Rhodobacteraceae bacterium M382]|nr:AAA family ATPase [Rhodobacteraceae bacterium M382]